MWIRTAEHIYLNSDHVLLAELNIENESAFLYPIIAGEYRGIGQPYFAVSETFTQLASLVQNWCRVGENTYLNVERFAYGKFDEDAIKAYLYLPEIGGLQDEFTFEGVRAERILAFVRGHRLQESSGE